MVDLSRRLDNKLEEYRTIQRRGGFLAAYLREKLSPGQLVFSVTTYVPPVMTGRIYEVPFVVDEYGSFLISMYDVPEKFWERVIKPELQRMADDWGGYELMDAVVNNERRVRLKKNLGGTP